MDRQELARRELARRELARRELARRGEVKNGLGADTRTMDEKRRDAGEGQSLSIWNPFGENIDTGVKMPQWMTETLAGMGQRMTQIGTLGTEGHDPVSDPLLQDSLAATVGSAVTDIGAIGLAGAGLSAAAGATGIGALGTAGRALLAPQKAYESALAMGLYGMLTGEDRLEGALYGAGGGLVGYGIGKGLSKVLTPKVERSAQELLDDHVRLTIGDTFGGWAKRIEDKLTSTPLLGDMITSAKKVSLNDFNRTILDKVVEPVGLSVKRTSPVGYQAIDEIHAALSAQYDHLLPMTQLVPDTEFIRTLSKIKFMSKGTISKETGSRIRDTIDNLIYRRIRNMPSNNRVFLGESVKEIDSQLGKIAWRIKKNPNASPADIQYADAIYEVKRALQAALMRQNGQLAPQLKSLDRSWHLFRIVEDASIGKRAMGNDGVFTASDLYDAVKRAYGRRKMRLGPFQKEVSAGLKVLGSSYPDSGTAGRLMWGMGTAGSLLSGNMTPLVGAMAASAPYTPTGMSAANFLLAKRMPWMLQASGMLPAAGAAAGGGGMAQ